MDLYVNLLVVALVLLFLIYFLVDVNYFLRAITIIIGARFFRTKIKFLGTSRIYGIVLPSDSDMWLTHMNNSRVLREFDFARFDHLTRSRMLGILWRNNGGGVVSAQTCRYRRPLHMFMIYKVVSTPVYYDSKNIFFEHKVISVRDRIVRCVAYVKLAVSLDLDKVVAKHYPNTIKPQVPHDLELWQEYIKVNSERLRNSKKLRNINQDEANTTQETQDEDPDNPDTEVPMLGGQTGEDNS